ncbi:MAG: nicotinate-nucleotide adenylyltransferase [Thiotrichales bacterium]|nr:nicotinate-nucleotide adenylyltransferase [Thiotrichales bacterium]
MIGIYGGTFDPIHHGHLRAALEIAQQLDLQQVRFIPCAQPVHRAAPNVSAQQRCAMLELAIADQPKFVLDRIEIERDGPSYMVTTLQSLAEVFAEPGMVLLLGTDAFAQFCRWHEWRKILQLANLAVMHRPGEGLNFIGEEAALFAQCRVARFTQRSGQILDVAITQLDIRSTRIRQQIQHGIHPDYLTPPAVVQFIQQQGLYQRISTPAL